MTGCHHPRRSARHFHDSVFNSPTRLCRKGKQHLAKPSVFKGNKNVYMGSNIKDNFLLNQISNVNKHYVKGQDGAS